MLNTSYFFSCIRVYKLDQGNFSDKTHEILSIFKKIKLKINNIINGNYKKMKDFPNFEQNSCSRTAERIYFFGLGFITILKYMAYYDRYYENINYYDLMASV